MAYATHFFDAPCGFAFKFVLGSQTYSIEVQQNGKRYAFSGRSWGASLTDSLMMAAYYGEPLRAAGALWFLFGRIDHYRDSPGILDLFRASHYRGSPEYLKDPSLTGAEGTAESRRRRALGAARRSFRSFAEPHHIDSLDTITRDAGVPHSYVESLFDSGVLFHTQNARGQPAFALAEEGA